MGAIDKSGHVHFYPWDKGQKPDEFEVVISYVPSEGKAEHS